LLLELYYDSELMNPAANPPQPGEPYRHCRAKRANGPGMVFCLNDQFSDCEHVGYMAQLKLCLNPDRERIIARTMALEPGP
jgi:hypothetical protein